MSDLLKRKGIIKVSFDILEGNPELVLESLKNILIMKADNDFMTNIVTYKGYSPDFDIVDEGEVFPEYVARMQYDGNGIPRFDKFVRG